MQLLLLLLEVFGFLIGLHVCRLFIHLLLLRLNLCVIEAHALISKFLNIVLLFLLLNFIDYLIIIFSTLINLRGGLCIRFQVSSMAVLVGDCLMVLVERILGSHQCLFTGMMMVLAVVMLVAGLLLRLFEHVLNKSLRRQQRVILRLDGGTHLLC